MKTGSLRTVVVGLVAASTLGLHAAADAAGTARVSTMSSSGKRVLANVDFTGPGNLRSSAVLHGRPSLVLRDGQAYVLVGNDERPLVNAANAEAANVVRPNTGDEVIASLVSLKNTGRKETRAGFACDVYEMSFIDKSGRRRMEQIAVSNDPRARELTDLWKSVNDALLPNGIPEVGDLQKQLQANGLGLMRFSFRYQVDRLEQAVRLPPVQAVAPPVRAPAFVATAPAQVSQPQAEVAQAVQPVPEPTPYERARRFTQGSIFGALFGG